MDDFDRLKAQKDRLLATRIMKRYELRAPEPSWQYGAYESADGEWVRYEEVRRLDAECNALVEKLGRARMDRDNERRWKEAAQRESEKLSTYISDLMTEVAIRQETIKQMAVERNLNQPFRWSPDRPTAAGWYWWRGRPDVQPEIHYLTPHDIEEGNPPGLWAGPIPEPGEAAK